MFHHSIIDTIQYEAEMRIVLLIKTSILLFAFSFTLTKIRSRMMEYMYFLASHTLTLKEFTFLMLAVLA
jgi:hypothetical protein